MLSSLPTGPPVMSEAFDPYYTWLSIPPEEQPPNHYRLLGVKLLESNADVIDNAADRQMAHVRSFQAGKHSAASQRLLNELAAARICLLSAEQKCVYDKRLKTPPAEDRPTAVSQPGSAVSAISNKPVPIAMNKPLRIRYLPPVRPQGGR